MLEGTNLKEKKRYFRSTDQNASISMLREWRLPCPAGIWRDSISGKKKHPFFKDGGASHAKNQCHFFSAWMTKKCAQKLPWYYKISWNYFWISTWQEIWQDIGCRFWSLRKRPAHNPTIKLKESANQYSNKSFTAGKPNFSFLNSAPFGWAAKLIVSINNLPILSASETLYIAVHSYFGSQRHLWVLALH